MTDPRPALHAAILADPGDLAARHAYADACEEHGDDARAAFVRASLAGDHAGASCSLDPLTWWRWFGSPTQDAADRERRLRVNVQAQPDGVLVHVWGKGERIRWGYQAVVRGGWIDELRMPLAQWLDYNPTAFHPVTRLRPTPGRAVFLGPGASGLYVRLWQDESIGRLRSLDLRALCPTADRNGYLLACARHAFRPWRGLGEVVLPLSASEGWQRHVRAQWGPVLDPDTRVTFAPPLPEDE